MRFRIWSGGMMLLGGVLIAALTVLAPASRPGYVIGAKNFTEQYILADLIGQRLERAGHGSTVRSGLGSAVVFRALAQNDIDVYVDYSGTIWANVMRRTDHRSEEHTSELQSLMRISYAVFCLKKKNQQPSQKTNVNHVHNTTKP